MTHGIRRSREMFLKCVTYNLIIILYTYVQYYIHIFWFFLFLKGKKTNKCQLQLNCKSWVEREFVYVIIFIRIPRNLHTLNAFFFMRTYVPVYFFYVETIYYVYVLAMVFLFQLLYFVWCVQCTYICSIIITM